MARDVAYFLGGLATSQELMRRVLAHALHVFRVIVVLQLGQEIVRFHLVFPKTFGVASTCKRGRKMVFLQARVTLGAH